MDAIDALLNVIKDFNEAVKQGIFSSYAITGATASLFYAEPVFTKDVDVLVVLPLTPSNIVDVRPVRNYFVKKLGYTQVGQHLCKDDVLVEFLPPSNQLEEEALADPRIFTLDKIKIPVLRPEYLIAISLNLGGHKHKHRAETLLEQTKIDYPFLNKILTTYGIQK